MSRLRLRAISMVFAAIGLCSCVEQPTRSAGMFGGDGASRSRDVPRSSGHGLVSGVNPGALQRGTDTFVDPAALDGQGAGQAIVVPTDGEDVQLSLVDASIEAAAKAVLGDTLKMSYVVSGEVKGRVTIQTTGPIPKAALLELFEAALSANGAQIRKEGNVLRIVPGTAGNTTFRVAGRGGEFGSNILVAPLKFISATEMAKLLQPLSDQGLKVVAEQQRNLLLLSGSGALLESALDALNLFDVDVLKGKSVALVQLRSSEPDAIVTELKQIFESEEGRMLNGVVEFIPNPRLGSVLIISSRASYLDKAQRWIRELDRTASGASVYMATYPLQNRSAAEVAPILNDLLSGGKSASVSGENSAEGEMNVSADGGDQGSELRVAADDSRNALIVRGRQADHEQVEGLLRELDSSARQVLLEATIAEVTLNEEVEVGTRWFFEKGNWDLKFTDQASGSVGGSSPAFTAIFGVGGANVALSALASVTDVKVISAPTLMVLDNKEGILQIGDQVPIAVKNSTSSTDANAPVITQIDYRDTGIILRVKPRISDGGRVMLEISQEVSDVARNRASGIDSPTIRQRKIQTSVALGDGQTLALGGLVQEGNNIGSTEVPGLGRVPVLGNLFRTKNSSKGRTELLILIRPRVIQDEGDAASATSYWRTKLSKSNSILETGLGSPQHTLFDFSQ